MTHSALRQAVLDANLDTVEHGLVLSTFGNASGIDRESGQIVIKPSGVNYDHLKAEDLVLCDINGAVLDNKMKPSSDLATHAALYRAFKGIGAVIHTHSTYATIMAQAHKGIPPLGTTHADYFYGTIPVTRPLTDAEIERDYVLETGKVIIETFADTDPLAIPAVLVAGHGPFVWGATPYEALWNAIILEEVARMAWHVLSLNPDAEPVSQALLDRHYKRKHGPARTYGQ